VSEVHLCSGGMGWGVVDGSAVVNRTSSLSGHCVFGAALDSPVPLCVCVRVVLFARHNVDMIAASFVRKAEDIGEWRAPTSEPPDNES
jgi:hypothetical protein